MTWYLLAKSFKQSHSLIILWAEYKRLLHLCSEYYINPNLSLLLSIFFRRDKAYPWEKVVKICLIVVYPNFGAAWRAPYKHKFSRWEKSRQWIKWDILLFLRRPNIFFWWPEKFLPSSLTKAKQLLQIDSSWNKSLSNSLYIYSAVYPSSSL